MKAYLSWQHPKNKGNDAFVNGVAPPLLTPPHISNQRKKEGKT